MALWPPNHAACWVHAASSGGGSVGHLCPAVQHVSRQILHRLSCTCGATVRGTRYGTRYVRRARGRYGLGAGTPYVQCVAPRGKRPCAAGTYSTQEAGTRSPYSTVRRLQGRTYVSAQVSRYVQYVSAERVAARRAG